MSYGVVVIGLGRFGLRRLEGFSADARFRVLAGADPRRPAVDGLRVVESGAEALRLGADVAVIAVPPADAPALVAEALETGHHVLCEKPPALSLAALQPVIAALRPDRHLQYGFNHRLHPSVLEARRLLPGLGPLVAVEGVYGRPGLAPDGGWRADPARAGGILLDQGIHLLDLCLHLAGPLQLRAATVRRNTLGQETHVAALLETAGGAPVVFRSSAEEPEHVFRLRLTGAQGELLLEGLATQSGRYAPERLTTPRGTHVWTHDHSLDAEREALAHALSGAPGVHGTLAEASVVLSLVDAILQGPP